MNDEKIARINALYAKAKEGTLTDAEMEEQKALRQEYIADFKKNLRGQLNNISIEEEDGSITDLGEKFGNKRMEDKR